jgi:signal transduction histidine kinase
MQRAIAATSALFEQKQLNVVVEIAPEIPPIIADKDRLIQVVINLLSNAVKLTDLGSVSCRVERSGDTVIISVTDTGMGIAPQDQPMVFAKFKQVGDTLTDKPKGTGLGLPNLQGDRRASRRTHLGQERTWQGQHLCVCSAARSSCRQRHAA